MILRYTLHVALPDALGPDDLAEVEAYAEPHDATLADKVARYIGGSLSAAERALEDELPDGWSVAIEEVSRG